jgi:RNA polymerase sigma factor (TIGR02999 family)
VPETGDITRLLQHWKNGQTEAFDELLPLVYPDLKRIAQGCLRAERPGHTLQATALVHELYLRLCRQREANWEGRQHFYTFAAKVMRMILTDHARRAKAAKRDPAGKVPLNEEVISEQRSAAGPRDFGIEVAGPGYLDLEMALDELEKIDARKTRVVELCHLIGCSVNEAAGILQISQATAERDLKFARGWLYQRLRP